MGRIRDLRLHAQSVHYMALEYIHRAANVPYFSGPGGVTPPGGNQGTPGSFVPGWAPDLRDTDNRMTGAVLVKF